MNDGADVLEFFREWNVRAGGRAHACLRVCALVPARAWVTCLCAVFVWLFAGSFVCLLVGLVVCLFVCLLVFFCLFCFVRLFACFPPR